VIEVGKVRKKRDERREGRGDRDGEERYVTQTHSEIRQTSRLLFIACVGVSPPLYSRPSVSLVLAPLLLTSPSLLVSLVGGLP
jgi:hypothetical protein